jgi:hypothetical protein
MSDPVPGPTLDALRGAGAERLDPARFRYLEALARRAAQQPEPVRLLLEQTLRSALSEFAERLARASEVAGDAPRMRRKVAPAPACAPLAELNAYIRTATAPDPGAAPPGEPRQPDELASVQRFRQAWTRSRTHERVDQASARKPANAGPLNSHVLVLQSLALMRELSPDYLRHFLVHVESLQWLEQARAKYPRAGARQAVPGKQAKATARTRAKK